MPRLSGEIRAVGAPGVGVEITREPVGVVGLIAEFRSPSCLEVARLMLAASSIFKPLDLVPGSAWALSRSLPVPAFRRSVQPGHGRATA
jgi:aldehyde dehydrogenase (NAD+)